MNSQSSIALRIVVAGALAAVADPARAQSGSAASAPAVSPETPASQAQSPPAGSLLAWDSDYADTVAQAKRAGRPILVRAGATWCGWCKELDKEIAKPQVQSELRNWARIYVDVDKPPKEARSLAFGPVPAFRILSSNGRLVDSRDGYIEADDLLEWLKSNLAAAAPPKTAVGPEASKNLIKELLADLDRRDPAVREAAIRRLMLVPGKAAAPAVEALGKGSLAQRLGVIEILSEWGAPVDGLDPWQPDTLSNERLESLRTWASKADGISTSRPAEINEPQLSAVKRDLAALLREEMSTAEADAIRERLARYGEALLPAVLEANKQASSDRARERLTCLRYRLVASDELVFSWPGGLERLAALDVAERHAAAEALVGRCTASDEPLLLQLFSDPDGLVREIALRGLYKLGGSQASGALVRLLTDPEPNVRAAVLKQMAESPAAKLIPRIAEYVATEKDPDLVVHAIRVLRAAKGKAAAECLMKLLAHANWQVRAEAAEGLGEILNEGTGLTTQSKKDGFAALQKLLEDSDGFVVSVAVKSLKSSDIGGAADAMARAADRHPELAADVLMLLAESNELKSKAIPHLRRFCQHENAAVRAVAIAALCTAAPTNADKELAATLTDSSSRVRIAGATALLQLIQAQRPKPDDEATIHVQSSGGLLGGFFGGFRKSTTSTQPASTLAVSRARPASTGRETASQPAGSPALSGGAGESATRPADQALTRETSRDDLWLEQFRSGAKRPKWLEAMVAPLEAMLAAESADERLIAAVDLIPFGRDEQALPVLLEAVRARPESAGTASGALPWLPWERRAQLFDQLTQMGTGLGTLIQISQNMAIWPDPRAAQPLWSQFSDPKMTPDSAARILESLRRIYFGNFSYNAASAPADRRKQAIADSIVRAQSGPESQRVAALALLLGASLKDAGEQATLVVEDAQAGETLRRDAFQILLLSATRSEGQRLAAEALAGNDAGMKELALRFLAEGGNSLTSLRRGSVYLYFQNPAVQESFAVSSGQVIKVSPPSGLKPEMVRPLLESPEPRVVAVAGYLLATMKDSSGLDRLVDYWRGQAKDDQGVKRLVYRAISALDDDSRTPVLEEVYRTYSKEDYWLRDYYWTIRGMSGPEVIKLRKVIRDEVGMDQLR